MNSMHQLHRPANRMNRLMPWPRFGALLIVALACQSLLAGDFTGNTYINGATVSYPGTETHPPMIDATNFVNSGTFLINFTAISTTQPFYETYDTLNYTNTGLMMANSGFQFDRQSTSTGLRTPASSFFNQGTISCGSTNNTSDPFGGFLGLLGYAQCLISATNIVNSGAVESGVDGRIQFAGQNLDLSHATLNMEGASANVSGTGNFGVNTNFWDPSIDLGSTFAQSAFFYVAPNVLSLTNSTAYIHQDGLGTSNVIYRAVFIQDTSGLGVSNNVYFGRPDVSVFGTTAGGVTIEWVGSYLNPADGSSSTHYLYLNDDLARVTSTNLASGTGIPANYQFFESASPVSLGVNPASAGFFNIFPAGSISNSYSFANIQLVSTTVATNASTSNPTGALTNLPGRIEIYASNELNLASAQITGPNYLSLQSPNQFDGSPGAIIESPYSDLNIGVTNGFLTISNLLSPNIPNWSGNIQAWSTRWLAVDSSGVTNDFRVLIVGSQVNPTSLAQVQDLILHGTNSIVISDTFNIIRTFKADAQNLTLTTNGPGVGAASLDGELNIGTPNTFWASALPNLRNLTNNGAIRLQNQNTFIHTSNNIVITPATSAVAASGKLSELDINKNVVANDRVAVGTNYYTFVTKITNTVPKQVLIGSKFDGSLSNLIAAINHSSGAGTNYSTNTAASGQVIAGPLTNHAFTVTAKIAGTNGNAIYTGLAVWTKYLAWGGSATNHLTGGADATPGSTNIVSSVSTPYDNFINNGLLADQGSTIWTTNFASSGVINNSALGSFTLNSITATFTNGILTAGGDVAITANSLVVSNLTLQAGRSLTLTATNLLTDTGVTNGNIWSVQGSATTGGNGLILPIKPAQGDLLGTTISNHLFGVNQLSVNQWAGQDRGVSVAGFTNNEAVGRLILDVHASGGLMKFSGASVSNALYVDSLEFRDVLTNGIYNSFDFTPNLFINTNLVIYFAQATANGISIAEKIDAASKAGRNNGGRLRWIPAYAGYFSSTNLVYPDGTTNVVNAALAASTTIDSDGDGTANASDPTPFFTSSQVGLTISATNSPVLAMVIRWNSVPGATNCVYYKTNISFGGKFVLTNFVSPSAVPPVGGWPIVNTVLDPINPLQSRFYNVKVMPNTTLIYGP
jgi:hypothetical protein